MAAESTIPGIRYVELNHGETLQQLSARELGDFELWVMVANLNGLVSPFVTADPVVAAAGNVALYGSSIMLPSASASISATTSPEMVFDSDVVLNEGELVEDGGDIMIVSGVSNLSQALKHCTETSRGELIQHLDYGSRAREMLGAVGGPAGMQLAGEYVKEAVNSDIRVREVTNVKVTVAGDVTNVEADVIPITGKKLSLEFQI